MYLGLLQKNTQQFFLSVMMQKLFLLLLLLTGCQQSAESDKPVRYVKALQLTDPNQMRSKPFPGVTRAENRVNLSFRVNGPLVEFPADVGDKVAKNQVLARIDPRDFEVTLRNAQANLESSEAALKFAESDYARADRIQKADPGAISESMVDKKREDRNRLRGEMKSYESQVDAAKDQLEYTYLRAPFDGMVVATYAENFEFVKAKQAVLRMLDTTRIEMVVDIPEHIISYIANIKKVMVTLDVFPNRKFIASIKEIGTEPSTTSRTYPVTLVMRQPKDVQILAGMSGEAKFIGKMKYEIEGGEMVIPASSLFSDDGSENSFVWIIDTESDTVAKREVELGRLTENGITIKKGLQAGEWIATAGVHYLHEGQKVKILDQ